MWSQKTRCAIIVVGRHAKKHKQIVETWHTYTLPENETYVCEAPIAAALTTSEEEEN